MQAKPVAVVTGANRGIGFQIAKDLAAHGFTVLVGSRNLEHGGRAAASIEGDARVLQLDVTDQASIDAAAERIRHDLGRLDVLVNNAGIMNVGRSGDGLEEQLNAGRLSAVALDEVRTVFDTNVFGVIAVTKALLPLLREAHRQHGELRRVAHAQLRPSQPAPCEVRDLCGIEGRPQRAHRRIRRRP